MKALIPMYPSNYDLGPRNSVSVSPVVTALVEVD